MVRVPHGDSTVYFSSISDRHLRYPEKLRRTYLGYAGRWQLPQRHLVLIGELRVGVHGVRLDVAAQVEFESKVQKRIIMF